MGDADDGNENNISASPITAGPSGGVVVSLSAYIGPTEVGDHIALALYSDDDGAPGSLIVNSASTTVTGSGWNTVSITPTTLAADTTYWIGYNSDHSDDNLYFVFGDSGEGTFSTSVTFGTWPSSFPGADVYFSPSYLLYATLAGSTPTATPTGSLTSTPTPTFTSSATATLTATGTATATATATPSLTPATRTIAYTYDGLQRLTGAVESPGSSFTYSYDLAGNRTGVTVDGTPILTNTYDAADQVAGWTYDSAGNLTSDGMTSYGYDATNDLTSTTATGQSGAYAYNGDGTLVAQTVNGTTTDYTQDLAGYESQILAGTVGLTTTDYLYGQDTAPLAALTGTTRTWYGIDGQGSMRQSLDDSGNILGVQNYDPFGQIEAGSSLIGPFDYTGELQDAVTGQEYLRARWYQPGSGTLLGVDPLLDVTGQPYSYVYDDPVNGSDPSGLCAWYDVVCEYNAAHTAAQQSSFGRGFYAGTTSLIRGIGTEAGAIGDTTISCLNPFDQTNCQNQRAANAATFAYISAHPTEALRAVIDAAAQPYACGDIAYDLGYGLPQIFLGALGALGEGADVLADTAEVEPGLANLPTIGEAADAGAASITEGAEAATARVFYSVQNEADYARLSSGGEPWPTAANKAFLGEGFYTWGTLSQATAYLSALEARGSSGLSIIEATISDTAYTALRTLDLRTLDVAAYDAWIEQHSRLYAGLAHGFEHIIRETGNYGPEYYFFKDAFRLFRLQRWRS